MKKGFTLVEIMIVVAIIGLLAAIAIPSFMRARTTSQANACINNLRQIESGKEQYGMTAGLTNGASILLGTLVGADGFIKQFPLCPATNLATGQTVGDASSNCYRVGVLGVNASCNIGSNFLAPRTHALPAQ